MKKYFSTGWDRIICFEVERETSKRYYVGKQTQMLGRYRMWNEYVSKDDKRVFDTASEALESMIKTLRARIQHDERRLLQNRNDLERLQQARTQEAFRG